MAIEREFYLSITLDRKAGCPVFIYSPAGGMSIEEVAKKNPEKIFKIPVDLNAELEIEPLLQAAKNMGLEEHKSVLVFLFRHLLDCF